MKETCEDCPEVADCLGICEKIKSQLEELPKWPPERSESLFNKKQRNIEKVSGDTPGIDRFRKINPAKVYEDVTDTEIDWEHKEAGIDTPREEYKSSARMDADQRMPVAREKILNLAGKRGKIAVFIGPFSRPRLGRQSLQAVQSVLLRNAIDPSTLSIYFDQEIFPSQAEADRLHAIFHYLSGCKIHAAEDSRVRVGIQVADAVAHCFGQIIKAAITGEDKTIDIGGANTGYAEGETAPLGWALLMSLRYALLTRPIVYRGEMYAPECDPVVLDPVYDDPVDFGQHPVLLGWGVQVAPEASTELRQAVEAELGRIWLGCIH